MTFVGPWPAPGKLNLLLRILGQRADGYHELQTVFQFIDLADELWFQPTSDGLIQRDTGLPDISESEDLTLLAARALQRAAGCRHGARIRLDKRLPMGAGLGGGSSDAATTLLVLNQLWETGLSEKKLMDIGLELGADVPVFLHGHAAWAEGVGEQLTDMDLPEPWYLVLQPSVHVSTAAVFRSDALKRDSPKITPADYLAGEQSNDCLPVVLGGYPEVRDALDWLNQHALARLTGTGACVFAEFSSRNAAEAVLVQVPETLSGFVAKGRNHSPVLDLLRADS